MIPLARELLRMGAEVVLCANSLPAINDITTQELQELIDKVADMCPIIKVPSPPPLSFTSPVLPATPKLFPSGSMLGRF